VSATAAEYKADVTKRLENNGRDSPQHGEAVTTLECATAGCSECREKVKAAQTFGHDKPKVACAGRA